MTSYIVGIGEMCVKAAPDILVTIGLGSCIGLAIYDATTKIGGLAHIMLPLAPNSTANKAKYCDTAVVELKQMMLEAGANAAGLVAKLVGGAHMFVSTTNNDIMRVGEKNIEACRAHLVKNGIPIAAEKTGGNVGRTIYFDLESGSIKVTTAFPKTQQII